MDCAAIARYFEYRRSTNFPAVREFMVERTCQFLSRRLREMSKASRLRLGRRLTRVAIGAGMLENSCGEYQLANSRIVIAESFADTFLGFVILVHEVEHAIYFSSGPETDAVPIRLWHCDESSPTLITETLAFSEQYDFVGALIASYPGSPEAFAGYVLETCEFSGAVRRAALDLIAVELLGAPKPSGYRESLRALKPLMRDSNTCRTSLGLQALDELIGPWNSDKQAWIDARLQALEYSQRITKERATAAR